MKKSKGSKKKNVSDIPICCDYCNYRKEDNKTFGFMWHCELIDHCVVFGQKRCDASKGHISKFELDKNKYELWEKNRKT